jgi:Glycosyl transferase family 2
MAEPAHVLTIVIPALNEEQAIGSTIQRCLDARKHIVDTAGVAEVELIVVSDGSTDQTEEIARGFGEVQVLVFERNRGYGAAIQCGFAHGRGDLVSFLDADGTCDPRFFADLCSAIDRESADVVLGSRMGSDSEMPWLRTLGNTIFAWILGILSQKRVGDTASGMRVIRRSVLPDLYPLPDGLHFTPAMSARILLEGKLRLVELPMKYAERVGDSKLRVLKDGLRFLSCIVQAAVAYRPARPLLLAAFGLGALALAVAGLPVVHYLNHRRLEEWMIYRLLMASLLTTVAATTVLAAVVADRIAAAAHGRLPARAGVTGAVAGMFTRRNRRLASALLLGGALALSWPGAVEYLSSGHVEMHWSRAVLSSLLVVLASTVGVTTFLLHMLDLIQAQRRIVANPRPPDRIHAARATGSSGGA